MFCCKAVESLHYSTMFPQQILFPRRSWISYGILFILWPWISYGIIFVLHVYGIGNDWSGLEDLFTKYFLQIWDRYASRQSWHLGPHSSTTVKRPFTGLHDKSQLWLIRYLKRVWLCTEIIFTHNHNPAGVLLLHFTGRKTKDQENQMTCPKPHPVKSRFVFLESSFPCHTTLPV